MSNPLKSAHVWISSDSVETNAHRVLPAMARAYFAAGRKVVARKTEPAKLHPFRLATKRFRYTLESFARVYGPSMKTKLGLLKPVQDALGEVNDCVATDAEYTAGKEFREFLTKRAEKKARKFFRAWKEQFDAPGQEREWVTYLENVPGLRLREAESAIHRQNLAGDELGGA